MTDMRRVVIGLVLLFGSYDATALAASGSAVTQEEIRSWVTLWQKRLNLEQWELDVRIVRQSELGMDRYGDAWWEWGHKAHIRVGRYEDQLNLWKASPAAARYRVQHVVVHELLHLVIGDLYDNGSGRGNAWLNQYPVVNQQVNAIVEAMTHMLMDRRTPGGAPVARYVRREIESGPWKPAPEVKARVMLRLVRAMNAANEDDILALLEVPVR
ncbi:MAG: hypothetical protein JO307_19335 [Bryobacterales bacterium]|nr:hypothetical protein [Bryobacterales bacterium]